MNRTLNFLFLIIFSFQLAAQSEVLDNEPISSCFGAVNIFEDGEFHLQFTGKKADNLISAYPSLANVAPDNQIWCSFIAPKNGELTFSGSVDEGFVQMVVFQQEKKNVCSEILTAESEIKRLYIKNDQKTVGLDYTIGGGVLYTLKLREGAKIQVLFTTDEKSKKQLHLNWKFKTEEKAVVERKTVDRRYDDFAPTFSIIVRDKETKKPLVAGISIEGSKNLDGLYTGSDFFFNVERNCQVLIKCDVEGYFFLDVEKSITAFEDQEITLELETIKSGKTVKIEEIEFVPGTSTITENSKPKLNRLKDFLALNADFNVEIQGHVFALGKNSLAGQRISEARAKRVVKYLVDNGIDKSRLKAVGYGNTRPVFVEPKFSYEEQANRRVEVAIL